MSGTTSTRTPEHPPTTTADGPRASSRCAGLVTLLIGLLLSVAKFSNATDATSVLGIVGTTIGALVGAYLGVAVGSAGVEKPDAAAAQAHAEAHRAKDAVALMAAAGQTATVQPIVQSLIGQHPPTATAGS